MCGHWESPCALAWLQLQNGDVSLPVKNDCIAFKFVFANNYDVHIELSKSSTEQNKGLAGN